VSIEYEVRSDDDYSRHVTSSVARELVQAHPGVRDSSVDGFLYQADRCCVEIQLGAEGKNSQDTVQWIGLRIPAGARLESATRAVEIGMALARNLGWRLIRPAERVVY
jgi:hypothetical protein